jgi:hypothetical protein
LTGRWLQARLQSQTWLAHSSAALRYAAPLCGFLAGMTLLYSRAAVPFLYFQF